MLVHLSPSSSSAPTSHGWKMLDIARECKAIPVPDQAWTQKSYPLTIKPLGLPLFVPFRLQKNPHVAQTHSSLDIWSTKQYRMASKNYKKDRKDIFDCITLPRYKLICCTHIVFVSQEHVPSNSLLSILCTIARPSFLSPPAAKVSFSAIAYK